MVIIDEEPDEELGDREGDGDAFKETVRRKTEDLSRIISMGKSFATVIFFSRRPEKADQSLAYIKKMMAEAGIKLETSVVSLETSLGGIIPTAFDRILAQRLGEKALVTLQKHMDKRSRRFHIIGIRRKEITALPYQDQPEGRSRACNASLVAELDEGIALMAEPNGECIGMGGEIKWTETGEEREWRGAWICKKCGQALSVSFNPQKTLCVFCKTPSCHNYGYIRVSRRL
jgi:hypothetical protein